MNTDKLESDMILFGLHIIRAEFPKTGRLLPELIAKFGATASLELINSAAKSAQAIFDLFEKQHIHIETTNTILAE